VTIITLLCTSINPFLTDTALEAGSLADGDRLARISGDVHLLKAGPGTLCDSLWGGGLMLPLWGLIVAFFSLSIWSSTDSYCGLILIHQPAAKRTKVRSTLNLYLTASNHNFFLRVCENLRIVFLHINIKLLGTRKASATARTNRTSPRKREVYVLAQLGPCPSACGLTIRQGSGSSVFTRSIFPRDKRTV